MVEINKIKDTEIINTSPEEIEITDSTKESKEESDKHMYEVLSGLLYKGEDLSGFKDINSNVAKLLIENGYALEVAENLESFTNLSMEVVEAIMKEKDLEGWSLHDYIASNIESFDTKNKEKIAKECIKKGAGFEVLSNLDKFSELDKNEIAKLLIQNGEGYGVIQDLDKFKGVDLKLVIRTLIENGNKNIIEENIEKFEEVAENNEVEGYIENLISEVGYYDWEVLDKIENLDKTNVFMTIMKRKVEEIFEIEYIKQYGGWNNDFMEEAQRKTNSPEELKKYTNNYADTRIKEIKDGIKENLKRDDLDKDKINVFIKKYELEEFVT